MRKMNPLCALAVATAVLLAVSGSLRAQEDEEQAIQEVFAAALERVQPSIVSITVEWQPGKDVFPPARRRRPFKRGTGPVSGVILTSDGLIITSDFNVTSDARSVVVHLADGTNVPATVLGRDVSRGIQLLKVDARDLPVPEFAPEEDIKVGRWALACGVDRHVRTPSLSVGIVSATERIQGRAIQIDASINPLNYGGPLIDIEGRVMGIITPLTLAGTSAGISLYDSGVGFAVPVNDIRATLAKLRAGETIHAAFLGIRFDTRKMAGGAAVVEVLKDTGAAKAGIKPGDVIVEFNGHPIHTSFKLLHVIGRCRVGDVVEFKVLRDGETLELSATLGPRTDVVR